jgi:hypothetical protein
MVINHSVRKLVAVALAAAAVAAATQTGSQPAGARAAGAAASSQGYPNAVPPILAVARPSELRLLESSAEGFSSDPPATGGYSTAEMDAFASQCGSAC